MKDLRPSRDDYFILAYVIGVFVIFMLLIWLTR